MAAPLQAAGRCPPSQTSQAPVTGAFSLGRCLSCPFLVFGCLPFHFHPLATRHAICLLPHGPPPWLHCLPLSVDSCKGGHRSSHSFWTDKQADTVYAAWLLCTLLLSAGRTISSSSQIQQHLQLHTDCACRSHTHSETCISDVDQQDVVVPMFCILVTHITS